MNNCWLLQFCSVPNVSTGLLLDIIWSHNKSSSYTNVALLSNSQQPNNSKYDAEEAETDFLLFTLNQILKLNDQEDQNTLVLKNKQRITHNLKPSTNLIQNQKN